MVLRVIFRIRPQIPKIWQITISKSRMVLYVSSSIVDEICIVRNVGRQEKSHMRVSIESKGFGA
jgi:hypothetical protein